MEESRRLIGVLEIGRIQARIEDQAHGSFPCEYMQRVQKAVGSVLKGWKPGDSVQGEGEHWSSSKETK